MILHGNQTGRDNCFSEASELLETVPCLILDVNPGSARPFLTHPRPDSSLGFKSDSKEVGSLEVDKPLQVIVQTGDKQEAKGTQTHL